MPNDMTDGHEKVINRLELVLFEYLAAKKNGARIDGEDPADILMAMPLGVKVLDVKHYEYVISTGGPGTSLMVVAGEGRIISLIFKVQDISGITRKDVTENQIWREFAQILLDGEAG